MAMKQSLIFSLLLLVFARVRAQGLVRTQGLDFVDESCSPGYFNGFNAWLTLEDFASDGPRQQNVLRLLDEAKDGGLSLVRIFAHGVTKSSALQPQPGRYSTSMLNALDRLLVELGNRGMRAILSLSSYWTYADGPQAYVSWVPGLSCNVTVCDGSADDWAFDDCVSSNCPDRDLFYTNPTARQLYRSHLSFMVSRSNSQTGLIYRDDPTIFSWNLMNEPNCRQGICNGTGAAECQAAVQGWVQEMGGFLKLQDPNHLITVGEDGMYGQGASNAQLASDPDRPPVPGEAVGNCSRNWSMRVGQNFENNTDLPSIDYAAIHIWPDNWLPNTSDAFRRDFVRRFLEERIISAGRMMKPLLVEEFGVVSGRSPQNISAVRDPVFSIVYNASLYGPSHPLKGSLFWQFALPDPSTDDQVNRIVTVQDSTFDLVRQNARLLASLSHQGSPLANCVPGANRSYEAVRVQPPSSSSASNGSIVFISRGPSWVVLSPKNATATDPAARGNASACASACAATPSSSGTPCQGFTFSSDVCMLLYGGLPANAELSFGLSPSSPLYFVPGATTFLRVTDSLSAALKIFVDKATFAPPLSQAQLDAQRAAAMQSPGLIPPPSEDQVLLAERRTARNRTFVEANLTRLSLFGESEPLPPLAPAPEPEAELGVQGLASEAPQVAGSAPSLGLLVGTGRSIGDQMGGQGPEATGGAVTAQGPLPEIAPSATTTQQAELARTNTTSGAAALPSSSLPSSALLLPLSPSSAPSPSPSPSSEAPGPAPEAVTPSPGPSPQSESTSTPITPAAQPVPSPESELGAPSAGPSSAQAQNVSVTTINTSRGVVFAGVPGYVAKEEGSTLTLATGAQYVGTNSAQVCAEACAGVAQCDAFSVNPNQDRCFLKKGADARRGIQGSDWTTYFLRGGEGAPSSETPAPAPEAPATAPAPPPSTPSVPPSPPAAQTETPSSSPSTPTTATTSPQMTAGDALAVLQQLAANTPSSSSSGTSTSDPLLMGTATTLPQVAQFRSILQTEPLQSTQFGTVQQGPQQLGGGEVGARGGGPLPTAAQQPGGESGLVFDPASGLQIPSQALAQLNQARAQTGGPLVATQPVGGIGQFASLGAGTAENGHGRRPQDPHIPHDQRVPPGHGNAGRDGEPGGG